MDAALRLAAPAAQLDPYKVTPGLLGFLVVVALGLATWALLRSMNRQLHKIDFEEAPAEPRNARKPAASVESVQVESAKGD